MGQLRHQGGAVCNGQGARACNDKIERDDVHGHVCRFPAAPIIPCVIHGIVRRCKWRTGQRRAGQWRVGRSGRAVRGGIHIAHERGEDPGGDQHDEDEGACTSGAEADTPGPAHPALPVGGEREGERAGGGGGVQRSEKSRDTGIWPCWVSNPTAKEMGLLQAAVMDRYYHPQHEWVRQACMDTWFSRLDSKAQRQGREERGKGGGYGTDTPRQWLRDEWVRRTGDKLGRTTMTGASFRLEQIEGEILDVVGW